MIINADLLYQNQFLTCYVMCDDIGMSVSLVLETSLTSDPAGTQRHAELRPNLPADSFPQPLSEGGSGKDPNMLGVPKVAKSKDLGHSRPSVTRRDDEFDDDELDAQDWAMVEAGKDS